MKFQLTTLLFILLLAWPSGTAHALTLKANQEVTWLGRHLQLLRDPSHSLKVEDIASGTYDKDFFVQDRDVPTFGYFDRNSYWAKVVLENPTDQALSFYIVSRYAPIDQLTVYSPKSDGTYQAQTLGDQIPFKQRPISYRYPIFPIKVEPGSHTFYLWTRTTSSTQFPLTLSSTKAFEELDTKDSLFLGLLCGTFVVMLFYNLFVYIKFRSRAYLFYVLYIASYACFALNYQGLIQEYLLPKAKNSWFLNIGMSVTIDMTCFFAYTFTNEFLRLKSRHPRIYRVIQGIRYLLLLNIVNWLTVQVGATQFTILNSFLLSFVLSFAGAYASFKKDSVARYYTLAWFMLLIGNMTVLLAGSGIVPFNSFTSWSQFTGAAIELILLSFALGARMADLARLREIALQQQHRLQAELIQSESEKAEAQAKLLSQQEEYIHNLDREVQARTRDIRSILKAINQGIFMLSPGVKHLEIDAEYSSYLSHLLHRSDLKGQDPLEIIFRSTNLSLDELDLVKNALLLSLGADSISFELNRAHLIQDLTFTNIDGQALFLEVDWSPIPGENGQTEKILVTLRDVTQLRKLREQTSRQEEDLWITGELTTPQGRLFPKIRRHGEQKIKQLEASLSTLDPSQLPEIRQQALVFLHTFKGETRVCGFRIMANAVHSMEAKLLEGPQSHAAVQLSQELKRLQRVLDSYRMVYEERLGRQEGNDERILAPLAIAQKILLQLEQPHPPSLSLSDEELELLKSHLRVALNTDLPTVLAHQISDLKNLAQELGKSVPLVEFTGANIGIPRQLHDHLGRVFGHLFRNSMDHGLEPKQIRLQKGKNTAGTLYIAVESSGDHLYIQYRDDGRGLDLDALAIKARQKGWILDNATHDPLAIANCIFLSGFSMSDQTNLISGRGLGMDAVRSLLLELGADIQLVLDSRHSSNPACYDFHFEISIPLHRHQLAEVG